MKHHFERPSQPSTVSSVLALHCSLSSGRQWDRLAEELGGRHRVIAPDLSGYGRNVGQLALPTSLTEEIDALSPQLGVTSEKGILSFANAPEKTGLRVCARS